MNNTAIYEVISWSHLSNLKIEELTELQIAQALLDMEYFKILL